MSSWKGDCEKSGGVATNIGIHFFDMLSFVFGPVLKSEVYFSNSKTCSGFLEYKKARVRWFLSIDAEYLPMNAVKGEKLTFRSVKIENEELEFSGGFNELHTESYKKILDGAGYGLVENRAAIATVERIRTAEIIKRPNYFHPFLSKVID